MPDGVRAALAATSMRRWLPGWRQMAAALVLVALGGAGGWWGDVVVEKAQRSPGNAFVHRALSAHAVYAYDMARPVEIGVNDETDLLSWLSERLGQSLKTPDLASAGFTLIGGRLVADQNEPAALFMYEDDANRRVTLYVRRGMGGLDTKFRFIAEDERNSLYWTDRALDYALTGDMPRADLLKLAEMISQEIEAKAST